MKPKSEKRQKNLYLSSEALKWLDMISMGNDSFVVEKLIKQEAERQGLLEKGKAS